MTTADEITAVVSAPATREPDLDAPLVAIVVVTWNSAAHLPGLLDSIPGGMAGLRYQLIIADNASADDTIEVARRLAPDCVVVQTGRNAGYAAGFNAGLAVGRGPGSAPFTAAPAVGLIADPPGDMVGDAAPGGGDRLRIDRPLAALILNPDIRLSDGCAARLYRELGDGTGIAVPRINKEDGSLALSLRRAPSISRAFGEAILGERAGRFAPLGETVVDVAAYAMPRMIDWATGAAMLISDSCLAACGPWDESFFLYSEETEFALRARDRGFATRYVPSAQVTHRGGASRVSPQLWSLLQVNRVRLYRKRHTAAAAAVFWSAVLLRECSRAALGHARSWRAVGALLRPRHWRDVVA